MVFIDGSNVKWGMDGYNQANKTKIRIDYIKLIQVLVGTRQLNRTTFYASKPIPPVNPAQIKFLDYIRSAGILIVEKELKMRTRSGVSFFIEKGVDVALATDLLSLAWENAYDAAILVSGDGDYVGAVSKVMSKGKNVEIASFRGRTSPDLSKVAVKTIFLDDIMTSIKV